MHSAQRVIKWLAVGFAVLIITGMVVALAGVGSALTGVLGIWDRNPADSEQEWSGSVVGDDSEAQLGSLVVDVKVANLKIESGDKFEVVADRDIIEFQRNGEQVSVVEREWGWFDNLQGKDNREVRIFVPEGTNLTKLSIDAGAGSLDIRGLTAEEADLDLGAGRTEIVDLTVTERAKIDGGAGYLAIRESHLKNLDLDMGVGKVELETELLGHSEIDAGVGKLELRLLDTPLDYRFEISKGLGAVSVNGSSLGDGAAYGEGENLVKISGGVGAIEISL